MLFRSNKIIQDQKNQIEALKNVYREEVAKSNDIEYNFKFEKVWLSYMVFYILQKHYNISCIELLIKKISGDLILNTEFLTNFINSYNDTLKKEKDFNKKTDWLTYDLIKENQLDEIKSHHISDLQYILEEIFKELEKIK